MCRKRQCDLNRRSNRPPTQDELPYSDGEPFESDLHGAQLTLLREPLHILLKGRKDVFVGSNMYVYFSPDQEEVFDFKGPDFFVSNGVKPSERKSYLVWEEQKAPDVVIELTSPITAEDDHGLKKSIYQNRLRVPEYFICDPYTDEFNGYSLHNGVYEPIEPDAHGRLQCKQLNLFLTRWKGEFYNCNANWLRWTAPSGLILPTHGELLDSPELHSELECIWAGQVSQRVNEPNPSPDNERLFFSKTKRKAATAKRKAEKLAARLKYHGIDPKA